MNSKSVSRYAKKPVKKFRRKANTSRYSKNKYSINQVFSYKRRFEAAPITLGAGVAISSVFSPSLSNLPNYTDFTALFDMYRITGIKISIIPNLNINNVAANQRFNVFSAIDYNDLSTITVAQAESYQNCKQTISTKTHSRYFKPKIAITQADVSGTSFVASYPSPWISTANTNIAHGFLKVVSDVNPTASSLYFTVNVELYVQFKNVN